MDFIVIRMYCHIHYHQKDTIKILLAVSKSFGDLATFSVINIIISLFVESLAWDKIPFSRFGTHDSIDKMMVSAPVQMFKGSIRVIIPSRATSSPYKM